MQEEKETGKLWKIEFMYNQLGESIMRGDTPDEAEKKLLQLLKINEVTGYQLVSIVEFDPENPETIRTLN